MSSWFSLFGADGGGTMATIAGFVGLGRMGKPMARNALQGGFETVVFDPRSDPMDELSALGATVAGSPGEVSATADITGIVVRGDETVIEVIAGRDGILETARPGSVIAVHTTVHPRTVLRMAEAAKEKGVEVIDAPISGGQRGAEAATLCYMAGGDEALLERCRPLFATSGSEIRHMGGLGKGSAMKAVHQTVACLQILAAREGMELAEASGLDVRQVQEVLRLTGAQSSATDDWLDRFRLTDGAGDGAGMSRQQFALMLLTLTPAIELARELGVGLPASALLQQLFPPSPAGELDL